MVAAYQTREDWYPVTLVKILVKRGKADINKESTAKCSKQMSVCWSPLLAAAKQGKNLEFM